ncbi:MAG: TrkH family potassium uptake protein [Deferribacteraceae bacterium]|nr:TrkH family potassium uptake protein [Deferribacteraceae bacterium]
MIPCALTALWYSEFTAFFSFIKTITVMALISIPVIFFTRKISTKKPDIRDGFLLVSLSWLTISLFASIPFRLSDSLPTWADAFFEASSGISTTGATVINDLEIVNKSILLWRSVTHWIGGMGIVVLSVALFPLLGIGGVQIMRAETSGVSDQKLAPRITQTAKFLWLIYTGFTLIAFVFLKSGGMSTFDAVNHAFSSVASGGFSTRNASIGYYDSEYLNWVIVCIVCAAGISFSLYYKIFTGKLKAVLRNTELKAYLSVIIATGFIIAFINYRQNIYTDIKTSICYSFFHVTSIITSAGFSAGDYRVWPNLSQFILFGLFFIGGCAGSTAGGFKVIRMVILLKHALTELRKMIHPRGVFMLRINGQSVNKDTAYSVSGFLFLYISFIIIVSCIAATADVDIVTAFSTGLSLVGNVGPAFGDVGPAMTYAFYPEYVKWTLGLAMIAGRLEIYAFFILFTPFFWKRL